MCSDAVAYIEHPSGFVLTINITYLTPHPHPHPPHAPTHSEPWFSMKILSFQYRKSHFGDKAILWPCYLHNGLSYTGKITSLYWIRALVNTVCILWLVCGKLAVFQKAPYCICIVKSGWVKLVDYSILQVTCGAIEDNGAIQKWMPGGNW